MTTRGHASLLIAILVVALIFIGVAAAVLFRSHFSFVQIRAETEVFRLDTSAGEPIAWRIAEFKAVAINGRGKVHREDLRDASTLELPTGTRVEVTRPGERGALRINLSRVARPDGPASGATACPVAYLRRADGSVLRPLSGQIFLERLDRPPQRRDAAGAPEEREALILPLRGRPAIGDDVATGVRYVLLSGNIRILEPRFLQGFVSGSKVPTSFQTAGQDLAPGDRVVPRAAGVVQPAARKEDGAKTEARPCDATVDRSIDDEPTIPVLNGFARIADGKPMTVVLQGPAEGVKVIRFGSALMLVRSSIWARASSDPLYISLAALIFVVLQVADWVWKLKELLIRETGPGKAAESEGHQD